MIAFAGYQRLKAGQHDGLAVTTTPRWPMTMVMGEVMRVAIYLQVIILVMKFKVVVTSNTLIFKSRSA
jgi:hypothetical protein